MISIVWDKDEGAWYYFNESDYGWYGPFASYDNAKRASLGLALTA